MSEVSHNGDGYVVVAEDLVKHFKSGTLTVRAVDGVSLRVQAGRMVAVRGPSGSGKSTLLNLIGALDRPDSGLLSVDGVLVSRLSGRSEAAYRRSKVGFVFQSFNLIPQLTAVENVEVPMDLAGQPRTGAEREERARELLRHVGLPPDRHDRRPSRLSGGEQQRVAIARALANDPPVLLADEPTANLDSRTGRVIVQLLRRLTEEGRTVIVATHDRAIAASAHEILEMRDGRLVPPGRGDPEPA